MTATPIDHASMLDEGRALRALARSLLGVGAAADADDVVQEGELAALRSGGPARRSAAWLAGTVRNLAKMLRRSEARRVRRERSVAREIADPTCDPAAIAVQAELARDVATAVQQLEEPFRTVVVLRFWNGLLPEAIAERLAVPRNTVRSRLQRGLERLRARLDAKYGARERWTAPLLVLAHGREVAVGAAASGAVGVATLGVLVQAKMLVVAGVLAAAAFVWFGWPRADAVGPPRGEHTLATAEAAAPASLPPGVPDTAAARREAVPVGSVPAVAAEVPADPTPVLVAPWAASFFVFDEHDRPIADATVTIRARPMVPIPREEPTRHTVRTDETGRVSVVLDGEAYDVEASKDGVGVSDARLLSHQRSVGKTTLLELRPALFVRGLVLRADGGPALGAEVTAKASASTALEGMNARPIEPVRTEADGRFTVPVQRNVTYRFVASLDGKQSFRAEIHVWPGRSLPEVTLAFPGAITIDGRVVDAQGEPVAGAEVTAWCELPDEKTVVVLGSEVVTKKADAEGRFSLAVRRHARYQVLAEAKDQPTSELVWVETSVSRPHVELRLALPRFATLRGRVLREDGSPLPGLKVLAEPETGASFGPGVPPKQDMPSRVDMFPKVKAATVADDGTFALNVHPGTTWTLSVRLVADNWRLAVHRARIAPGRDDVLITVTEADVAGCVVVGNVVGVTTPAGLTVSIVDYGPDGESVGSSEDRVQWEGNRFECRPLPRGQLFGLRVQPSDQRDAALAPSFLGPFRTDAARLEITVPVAPWGRLPVRVLRADGSPARRVSVYAQHVAPMGYGTSAVTVDGEGRAALPRSAPGTHLIYVSDDSMVLHKQEVTVTSGANPELVIRLAK